MLWRVTGCYVKSWKNWKQFGVKRWKTSCRRGCESYYDNGGLPVAMGRVGRTGNSLMWRSGRRAAAVAVRATALLPEFGSSIRWSRKARFRRLFQKSILLLRQNNDEAAHVRTEFGISLRAKKSYVYTHGKLVGIGRFRQWIIHHI